MREPLALALAWSRSAAVVMLVAIASIATLAAQETKVPDAQQLVGSPRGAALSGPDLDRRTVEVAALLRCPVCQGLSIGDSPSAMAQNMKLQVRDLLARGYNQEQILSYFESSYGQFVLLEPKKTGVNWLVWLAPLAALLIGSVVVFLTLRSANAESAAVPAESSPIDSVNSDPSLAPYVDRVRDLVSGKSKNE